MHSRRSAAAFLTFIVVFVVPAALHAEGATAAKQCPAEEKNKQEYQPAKPWNKYFTEKRDGKTVTILNLFGKSCKDVTNEEVVTGHCIRADTCKADKTSEGEKPQQANCTTINKDDPGCQAGAGGAGSEGNESTDIPDAPKPDNSDGVLPIDTEQKPTTKPVDTEADKWKTGTTPFNNTQTNDFGTELQKAANTESWFAKTIENYFSSQDPMGPNTSGIGNSWGAQSVEPQGNGGSLYEQAATNRFNVTNSFGEPVAPAAQVQADTPWYQSAATWVGEKVGAAADYAATTYNSLYESIAGVGEPAASGVGEETVPTEVPQEVAAAPQGGLEPLEELTPEQRQQINEQAISDREVEADREQAAIDQARATEGDRAAQREADAQREYENYQKALAEAERSIPKPEAVQTDPQKEFERANREDAIAAAEKSPLPNGAPEGRSAESLRQEIKEWNDNVLKPSQERIEASTERIKDLRSQYDAAVQRADNFRDDNMVGLAKDGVTPQFKTQAEVDEYRRLQSQTETARQNLEAERLTNDVLRQEYGERLSEVKELVKQYDNLPAEDKAFDAIQQQKLEAQVKSSEIAEDLDKQRALRDDPNAAYSDRMAAALKVRALEKQMSAQEAINTAMENRQSCVYNCSFGKALADAYKPVEGTLSPEQQAQRTGILESAQQWANAQRALSNPPDFSTVTNPETGIYEPNPRAAEDLARWQSERQADIDRANQRGEEFAGLRERSQSTQDYIDAKTGNQNPLLTAYQTYIDGLKTVAGLNLETPMAYVASKFTDDQQLIDGFGDLGKSMAVPMAPMVGIGAGAGEQFLGAVGQPLPETQLSNLYKSDDALAIQRTLDIGATALNAIGFAPESMLAKAGSLFSAERVGMNIADDLGSAVAAETRLGRLENQLSELNSSYEHALGRVGTDAAPSTGELAAMRNEISSVESTVQRLRASEGGAEVAPIAEVPPPASAVPQEIRVATAGDVGPVAASAEVTNAPRALVTAADATEAAGAISRGAEAGVVSRVGVADINGERFIYEAKPGGDVVFSPASGARVGEVAPATATELNAIADAKGISPVVNEPTILRDLVGPVNPAERIAITKFEEAARDVNAWRASPNPVGPSPISRLVQAEQDLEKVGLTRSIDGNVYRPTTGEVLGRIDAVETGLVNAARSEATVPQYAKAGDQWFETNNMSKPITNPEMIQALEAKLPTNSIPASQIAADVNQAKGVAAAEAKEAERAAIQRAAQERAAREAAEKAAEKNPPPPAVRMPDLKKTPERAPRLDNSPEVIADLKRLEALGDKQALAENGRILTGPTTQSIRDGIAAFKNAGGVPSDVKFAKPYLESGAVYRISPEGNLSRITDAEVADAVKNATNPTIRTTEAESIGREAQHMASLREVEEALNAKIAAAKAYDGEIMVAQDVREATRALAGDVEAIARQAARDATTFAWAPEAELPLTLAEANAGKPFLTEVEKSLANPFKQPTTDFGRGGYTASSDGISPGLEPYRAPQSTFTDSVRAAVQERIGVATAPELLAERAGLEIAKPVPSPRTAVQDLVPSIDNIPLVEIKPAAGTQVGDALTLPEASAIHSFNSALANYSKALESGGDLSRAAEQLSGAYTELAEVGIKQRASDGALARESGEPVAVRVSPPMAAQAAYAVVVPVDSQVREFATGATDETFSFTTPDLRVLSSDFGVQPPISADEAITIRKAIDVLDTTRSRDSLEYIFDNSDLRIRPEDGYIVRRDNGEVVARPSGASAVPGGLPETYIPAGEMPPLPVKLVRTETVPNGNTTQESYEAQDYRGRKVADIAITIDGAVAKIEGIRTDRPGNTEWAPYSSALSASSIRSVLTQFHDLHPDIVALQGQTGRSTTYAGEWDPNDIGEPIEMILPTIPADPIPVRASGNGPAALALGLALSVASPLPISAIADAVVGPNNAFSTAAQAAPGKPSPRDIERRNKAIQDIAKVYRGVASWYGTGSNSGTNPSDLTASGAWHKNTDYTVAMLGAGPKYAWGTKLLVKNVQEFKRDGTPNPNYGKEVEVIVTSTGGQPNRALDLSPAARDAIGIGDDGTALVEFTVVSVPDPIDTVYRKGRTDLTGGSPIPKGTFNARVAELRQNPTIALAQAQSLSGNPAVVGVTGKAITDAIARAFSDVFGADTAPKITTGGTTDALDANPTPRVERGADLPEPLAANPTPVVARGADLPEPLAGNPIPAVERGTDLPEPLPANPVPQVTSAPITPVDTPLDGNPSVVGAPARAPTAPAPTGPIESFGVTGRRSQSDAQRAPNEPANDNAPAGRVLTPTQPIRYITPEFAPVPNIMPAQWPTIAAQRPALVLEGEILPPAPLARSESQVAEPKPVLDLKANPDTALTETRGLEAPQPQLNAPALDGEVLPPAPVSTYVYAAKDALRVPKAVIDLEVINDRGLVTLRSADGVTIPSVEEVESLLRQLKAMHPEVRSFAPAQLPLPDEVPLLAPPTVEERGLAVIPPPVNVLPALENILITGPTLYVNSAGTVWPTLGGAAADAALRKALADIRPTPTPAPVNAAPSVVPPRVQAVKTAKPQEVIEDAIRNLIAKDVLPNREPLATEAPAIRPQTQRPSDAQPVAQAPAPQAAPRPSVPQSPKPSLGAKPDTATPPPIPGPTIGERAKNIWSDTKLAARISRGVVFPASTIKRNVAVNAINMMTAYTLTGPYTVITWPALNVGWRYVFNKDYRADVNSVVSRVSSALSDARAAREAERSAQELLQPNMSDTNTGRTSVPQVAPQALPAEAPQAGIEEGIADLIAQLERNPAPEVSIEQGMREIVADIKAAGPSPEQIIDQGIQDAVADVVKDRVMVRSYEMPSASPVRTLTVVPLSKIDDLVAPKTAGTMRIYRGIGEAYDPTYTGADPYFTPDYVEALDYAMKRAMPGSEPHLLIAEVNTTALSDMYAYRKIQSALKERPSGFGELTSSYIQLPKDWFDTATFDPKFPHDIAGLDAKITEREAALPDWIQLLNSINDRRIAVAVKYIETLGKNSWAELSTQQQETLLMADPEYKSLRQQFKDLDTAQQQLIKEIAQEYRANNPLPKDPIIEGEAPRVSDADRLTETVQEFAADKPTLEKWGPFSNILSWFRNLGGGGSGGSGGGNGGNGSGGETPDPDPSEQSKPLDIKEGLKSVIRLIPGLANLISNAPQPTATDAPKVDVSLNNPKQAGNTPKPSTAKPAETKQPDSKPAPKPNTETKPPVPPAQKPPNGPGTTTQPPPSTPPPTPTNQSAPTGGTNSGSGLSGLMSMLSGFLKGLGGQSQRPAAPQPRQPLPNGGVTAAMYAQPNPAMTNESVTISWGSTNATTCSVFNASSTKVASGVPGGSFKITATSVTKYTAYCSNQLGQYASATVQLLMK